MGLLRILQDQGVEFVLIGGAAIESYGESYRTNDIDVLPERSAANLGRLAGALNSLDCRLVVDPDDPGQDVPLPAGFFTAPVIARQEIWNLRTRHGDLDVLAAPAGVPRRLRPASAARATAPRCRDHDQRPGRRAGRRRALQAHRRAPQGPTLPPECRPPQRP